MLVCNDRIQVLEWQFNICFNLSQIEAHQVYFSIDTTIT